MALNYGPTIVTDGLMLTLDASDTTSYPGTGTIWYDISGNGYQATMSNLNSTNWVTYNGVKAFETNDTNNQGFRITSFPFPQNGRTYEIWLNSKSFSIGWQTWFDDSGNERVLFGTSTNTIHVYPGLDFVGNLVAGQWYQLAYTMIAGIGSQVVAYKNGISVGSAVYTYNITSTPSTLYILGDAGTENTSCYCSIARVYNRVLTPQEIQQNYNATKTRFGL